MSRPKNPPPRTKPLRVEARRADNDEDDDEQTPPLQCHLWAKDLRILLDDETGCVLFETFLREEECDLSELYFVYSCRGLRLENDPAKKIRCARAIYKNYLKNGTVRAVSEDVKTGIRERLEQAHIVPELFSEAIREVTESMMKTTFARFIQSDAYIQHVQRVECFGENAESSSPTDCDQSEDLDSSKSPVPVDSDSEEGAVSFTPPIAANKSSQPESRHHTRRDDVAINNNNNNESFFVNQMPTLDEGEEFRHSSIPMQLRMNRKPANFPATQQRPPQSRAIKRQSQLGLKYMEQIDQPGFRQPPNPYHVRNSCYVPPSAYHSDIQSMSSGNYTDLDTEGKRREHDRRHQNEIDRRKPERRAVNSRDHLSRPIPRTIFPIGSDFQIGNYARTNPAEFHRILCEKLLLLNEVLDESTEDKVENQSILDDHVKRVFETPPAQTPRAPTPPLERQLLAKMRLKSPYQMTTNPVRNVNNNRSTDMDSAIYTCGSAMSSTAPMALPRGRYGYPVADSGCDDSVVDASSDNLLQNVSDWFTRNSHEPSTSKGKNKASVCSGSNRSSRSGPDFKKKGQSSNKDSELVVGYHYEGDEHPFVIRFPQRNIRLRDFKNQLTRKGAFRYFFKCPMEDFGTQAVYEEVKDDNRVLPLWDGKVFAKIYPEEHSSRPVQGITM